jgi:hypothetical protein
MKITINKKSIDFSKVDNDKSASHNILTSVVESHHFYAAPAQAPGKIFDAAPAPPLLYSKTKILKRTKV